MIRPVRNFTPAEHPPFIRNVFEVYEGDAKSWYEADLKPSSFFLFSLLFSLAGSCAVTAATAVGGVTEMRLIRNSLKTVAKFRVSFLPLVQV